MSGGVDSTVAALLLLKNGCSVTGVTMEVAPEGAPGGGASCYGPENIVEIKRLAARLGISHSSLDLRAEYEAFVLAYFKSEYAVGRTPNPCVMCNRQVKFGALLEKAASSGINFDKFATGHYARLERDSSGGLLLKKGRDARKDQTYFLWNIPRKRLERVLFPLGGLTKEEVRELAVAAGFEELAGKPESQDFAPPEALDKLLDCGNGPGDILDSSGAVCGRHKGIARYTVGQRKGLGIGGLGEPLFVSAINPAENTVTVSPKSTLSRKLVRLRAMNWVSTGPASGCLNIRVKIRRQHEPAAAKFWPEENGGGRVEFEQGQFAPTPGQSAVLYDGDVLLGGGIIESAD